MNNYDNFKKDNYQTALTTTMIIDLQTEDNKIIYIVFNPLESDNEHTLTAEVFTAYKNYGNSKLQFGSPCNYGDELAIREMVINNYLNNNLFWAERIDDEDNEELNNLYNGESLDDDAILQTIKEAADDFEDGAILEAHDKLLAVVDAIAEFNNDYSED